MKMSKKIIIALVAVLIIILGIGFYLFFNNSGALGLNVKTVEAATGKALSNVSVSIAYECKDRLGAATTCNLASGISDQNGLAKFDKDFQSGTTYTLSGLYKDGHKSTFGRIEVIFKSNTQEITLPIITKDSQAICPVEVYAFDDDEISVINHEVKANNIISLSLDTGTDTTIKLVDINIIDFGNLTLELKPSNKAELIDIPAGVGRGLGNGCYAYAVEITSINPNLGITTVSKGEIGGAFWQ